MKHLESIEVHRFRGLRSLSLQRLGQVNLLVGVNNSGKTSALEAIELHCHPLDPGQVIHLANYREVSRSFRPLLELVRWLFPHSENPNPEERDILISAMQGKVRTQTHIRYEETRVVLNFDESAPNILFEESDEEAVPREVAALRLFMNYSKGSQDKSRDFTITGAPFFIGKKNADGPTKFVGPSDHRTLPVSAKFVSDALMSDRTKVLKLLQMFDDNIEELFIAALDGRRPVPYLKHKRLGHAPISVFGDGLRRAILLATAVVQCENGILLVDELETGVHAQALHRVFNWLLEACKEFHVQLFATTHSLEAIDAILYATDENTLNGFVTYRLETKKHETIAKRFSGTELQVLRNELGQDVR